MKVHGISLTITSYHCYHRKTESEETPGTPGTPETQGSRGRNKKEKQVKERIIGATTGLVTLLNLAGTTVPFQLSSKSLFPTTTSKNSVL